MKSYLKMKTRFFIQTEKSATVYIIIKKEKYTNFVRYNSVSVPGLFIGCMLVLYPVLYRTECILFITMKIYYLPITF